MAEIYERLKASPAAAAAAGGDLASRVYRDEPILITFERQKQQTNRPPLPPQYAAMRDVGKDCGTLYKSYAETFYEQGKFMEDFEDDYDFRENFARYFPTYQSMNDSQLRGYFSWRSKVRRGAIENAPLSFAFVYIYELLNLIGAASPEEGFYALKNFWTAYREIDAQIDRYVKLWLQDYVVYYNLDKSLLEGLPDIDFNNAVLTLFNYTKHSADEIFSALNSLSSYDFGSSRFFKRYPDDVKSVIYDVFAALPEYREKLFGQVYANSYYMFKSAVFFDRLRQKDFVYEINALCKYVCKNGIWSCERFLCCRSKNQRVGALLKAVDYTMRQKYNFKSTMKAVDTDETLRRVIDSAVENYLLSKREAARPQIEIDVSKLRGIREAAMETQDKLLAEPEAIPAVRMKELSPLGTHNKNGLDGVEYRLLQCLLYGRDYDELLRSSRLPLSMLVDSVNETLFERFGDTVIIEDGGRPELVADYIEELKEIIK